MTAKRRVSRAARAIPASIPTLEALLNEVARPEDFDVTTDS